MLSQALTRKSLAIASILFCIGANAWAAEIRGTVLMDYQGLFEVDASAQEHRISVSLLPDEDQPLTRRLPQGERIEIVGNRMQPAFLTIRKGDSVAFVNRDPVFHEIFSLSPGNPVSVRLDKADASGDAPTSFALNEVGTTHFFCRIHSKSYARVDVVDTPYVQMISPGQDFHFTNVPAGKWKLRLASPAAETQWFRVTALTSPPPLKLTLSSRVGGSGHNHATAGPGAERLYQR